MASPGRAARTVLIVEDDPATRLMYRSALQTQFNVIAVEDGLIALQRIDESLPDVIVLDLILPRLDGMDVYKEVRASPRTRHIPVIIVTASDAQELQPTERSYFLRKPVTPDRLIEAVEDATRQHRHN